VVHGGSVPRRYPEWVREKAAANARQSLRECAAYARAVGVPLCLENQPQSDAKRRYTTTPEDLEDTLAAVSGEAPLGVALDVGHAKANGHDWRDFVGRFGDRIRVCHLHDNDGTGDHHDPLTEYEDVVEGVPADYFVFETKSVADVARSVGADVPSLSVDSGAPSGP
jgi:sugar phosphate isomerase/epimerase